ncbi:hypothetical protein BASA81_004438 [Batrachochytrium salamandrivorans]|nr:hypothetical protein BASA81_004438 [Batrachochytrium salamandrivorans]
MKLFLAGLLAGALGAFLTQTSLFIRAQTRVISISSVSALPISLASATLAPTIPASTLAPTTPANTLAPTAVASKVARKSPRVFCFIPSRHTTSPLMEKIAQTWISTCDKFIFTATQANPKLNVVKIDYPTTANLWNMIHPAWSYIEKHYGKDYDWFVKVDDDSYFSGANFKHMVKDFNPEDYYYLGHQMHEVNKRADDPRAWFNLGAGHALSRASLRKMALYLPNSDSPNRVPKDQQCPPTNTWAEDVELSTCLHIVGDIGYPNNSRDAWGRENFMALLPADNFLATRHP